MKEKKTNKKKVLTDEELMGVTGGDEHPYTATTRTLCGKITNKTECVSSKYQSE